jgi:drug/metabolite transporter (DMT)-like permease
VANPISVFGVLPGLTERQDAAYLAVQFLLLKIAASVGMGLVLKQADAKGLSRLPIIRVNYAVAAILAFLCAVMAEQTHISRPTMLLAVVTGGLFVAGILLWAGTIETAGLALSIVAMRTAVVIPVAGSVIFWREHPGAVELAGSAVALLALGLVLSDVRRGKPGTVPGVERRNQGQSRFSRVPAWLWLLGLFVVEGLVLSAAQVFRKELPQSENLPFQTVIFISAFVITTFVYYVRKTRVDRAALSYGAMLGAANFGNYLFLILALTVLPGIVVYPVIAAAEVGLLALAGVAIWHERLGVRSWFGIGLAVLALALLQAGRTLSASVKP